MDKQIIFDCLEPPLEHTESDFLYPFQRDNVDKMREIEKSIKKGMLCDEMGLGKTIQMLQLIKLNNYGPTLIISPKHLLNQWKSECKHYFPTLTCCNYNKDYTKISGIDVVFSTYNLVSKEFYFSIDDNQRSRRFNRKYTRPTCSYMEYKWYRIIIDEGQLVDNTLSKISQMCCKINAECRWFCTGTPFGSNIKRDLQGISTYLHLPMPEFTQEGVIDFLRPIFIRHNKATVLHQLDIPSQQITHHRLSFSMVEREIYERELNSFILHYSNLKATIKTILDCKTLNKSQRSFIAHLTTTVSILRQLCSSPKYISMEPIATEKSLLDTLYLQTSMDYYNSIIECFHLKLDIARNNEFLKKYTENQTYLDQTIPDLLKECIAIIDMTRQLATIAQITINLSSLTLNHFQLSNSPSILQPILSITTKSLCITFITKFEHVVYSFLVVLHHFLFQNGLTCNHINSTEDNHYLHSTQLIRDYCLTNRLRSLKSSQSKFTIEFTPIDYTLKISYLPTEMVDQITQLDQLYHIIHHAHRLCHKWTSELHQLMICDVENPILNFDFFQPDLANPLSIYDKNAEIQVQIPIYLELIHFCSIYINCCCFGPLIALRIPRSQELTIIEHVKYIALFQILENTCGSLHSLHSIIPLSQCINQFQQHDFEELKVIEMDLQKGIKSISHIKSIIHDSEQLMKIRYLYFLQLQHFSDGVKELDQQVSLPHIQQKLNTIQLKSAFLNRKLTFLRSQLQHFKDEFTCAICFEKAKNGVILVCGHVFMKSCFYNWYKQSKSCPTCRCKLQKDNIKEFASGTQSTTITPTLQDTANALILNYPLHTISCSSKINYITKMVLYYKQDKLLIFSAFDSILQDILISLTDNYCTGLLGRNDSNIQQFKQDLSIQVLLLNTKTENNGLSLQCANHIIFVEPFTDSKIHQQAMARINRIGQQKQTTLHYIVMKQSIEEKITVKSSASVGRPIGHDLELTDVLDLLLTHN